MNEEKHPDLDWWLSVRDSEEVNPQLRRSGDILYGAIKLFRFPKTHRNLRNARWKAKVKRGAREKAHRLSHQLKINGPKWLHHYFTPYYKTVKGIRWGLKFDKKPRKQTVEYGGRHRLIVGPRIERFVNRNGPIGG